MRSEEGERHATEQALLGFLTGGPRYGYDLYREITDPGGLWLVWRMKQSQLYALLTRLEDRGLLASSLEARGGRPPRKMYRLTESGRDAFQRWVQAPVERGRQFRLDLLTRLFFARREGRDTVEGLLDAQRTVCRGWLDDLQAAGREAGADASYRRLVLDYRAGQVRAMLDWLDACRDELVPPTVAR